MLISLLFFAINLFWSTNLKYLHFAMYACIDSFHLKSNILYSASVFQVLAEDKNHTPASGK